MKQFVKNIVSKARGVKAVVEMAQIRVAAQLRSEAGNFVVDNGVVYILIIAAAAVALVWLKSTIPELGETIKQKMLSFFN